MDSMTAYNIGKKARALRHCEKVLAKIDKEGSAKIILGCTGVELIARKNDTLYLNIQKKKYELLCEIQAYEITVRAKSASGTVRRTAPAPVGASDTDDNSAPVAKRTRQNEQSKRRTITKNKK